MRELEHVVERLVMLKPPGESVAASDLSVEYRCAETLREEPGGAGDAALRDSLEASERDLMLRTMERCGGNRHKAAVLLGIHPAALFRMLNRHHIQGNHTKDLPGSGGDPTG